MPVRSEIGLMPRIRLMTMMAISPKPPLNRPPPSGRNPPPKPPPPNPPPPNPPPSPRRSSMLLLSLPSISMAASPFSNYIGGDESHRRYLEHQFGASAHRQRRTLSEVAQAGRAVPAGDQVSRRILPPSGFRGAGLQAPAGAGDEGL